MNILETESSQTSTRAARTPKAYVFSAMAVVIVLCLSQAAKAQDAHALVSAVIQNELEAGKHPRYWMYVDDNTQHGKREVTRILQTPQCWFRWPVKVDGHNATADEQKDAESEIQKLLSDDGARQDNRKKVDEDSSKADTLLKIFPDAFLFAPSGRQGALTKIAFRPNPNYSPSSNEAKVFHNMAGTILVNAKEKRLAGISGRLIQDVDFFGGILGKLRKGGTFSVIQKEVAPQDWEVTTLDVHISGKALFFHNISEQQHEIMTNFQPVPANLSLKDAASRVKSGH